MKDFKIILIFIMIFSGCAIQSNLYNKAIESNDINDYKKYLDKYPDGKYSEDAKEYILYIEAKEQNTIESYEKYLRESPTEKYWEEIKYQLAVLQLNIVINKNTIESYETYLKKYPLSSGMYSELSQKAENNLALLELKQIAEINTIAAYKEFLLKHPKSKYFVEVKECMAYLEAIEKNDINIYKDFFEKYPYSSYKEAISEKLINLEFEKAKQQNTLEGFSYFKKTYFEKCSDSISNFVSNKIEKLLKSEIVFDCELLPQYCNLFKKGLIDFLEEINKCFNDYKIKVNGSIIDISLISSKNIEVSLFTFYDFDSDTLREAYMYNSDGDLILTLYFYQKILNAINRFAPSEIDNIRLENVIFSYKFIFGKDSNSFLCFFGDKWGSNRPNKYYILCCTEKYGEHYVYNDYEYKYDNFGHYVYEYFRGDNGRPKATILRTHFKVPNPYSLDGSLQNSANIYEYFGLEY